MDRNRFSLYGNELAPSFARRAAQWEDMFIKRFDDDLNERYDLSVQPNLIAAQRYFVDTLATSRSV